MKRPVWLLIGGLFAGLAITSWLLLRPGGEKVAIDLVQEFPHAKDRRPRPEVFSVIDATIGGVTKHSIFTQEPTRIIWQVTVPEEAWLAFSIALKEESWTLAGDGVLFMVAASDAQGTYDELLNIVINPFSDPGDRRWHDLSIDLSQYAGERIDLIFNTRSSLKGDDRNGDFAVWGAPRVAIR